jgi:hypothetical protein
MNRGTTLLALALMGCTATATGTGTSTPSPGPDPSSPATTSNGGKCIGTAKKAYDLDDRRSCEAQGGTWEYSLGGHCTGDGAQCDGFNSVTGSDLLTDCTNIIGCQWQNEDATIVVSAVASGRCSGTPTDCAQLPEDLCRARCQWKNEHCEEWGGSADRWDNAECTEIDTGLVDGTVSPEVAREACEWRVGCVWSDGDGHLRR